jgi:RNA polymerase sigma factor (sigma-70 family)
MSSVEFDQLLLSNRDFLKPFAVTLTHDQDKADDLIQETFYRALLNKDKYNLGTNLKAWLYTIMRNIFINEYRRKAKQRVVFDNTPNDYFIDSAAHTVANDAESKMTEKELQEAVEKLPTVFKKPFLLYFNGYKYEQIASMMMEPIGTIKSRIHFARKLLKQFITKRNNFGLN